ncbi:MAG: hypothetical protein DMD33_18560 [Gemmatimonadetes bacterium]|nr:MAG: hypothetical protein DMD33_18560 [Gemmatimonadota bacterium]
MTTRKQQATDNGHALAAIRDLWRDGNLDGARVRALGAEYSIPDCIDFTADSASVGESRLVGLVQRAGRSAGFDPASNALDREISDYLDGTYGRGRWRYDRPPHLWERGGGDADLDRLFQDQDVALADLKAATDAMFAARDEASAAGQGRTPVAQGAEVALAKARAQAVKDFELADERASIARARVTTRAGWLQNKFRVEQARKGQ